MKSIKKYYLLLLLIITLACVSIYGTYAMFTSEIGIDAFKLEASTIPVDQEIMEYEKITINANDSKTISLNVSNSTSQVLHYGAWYQMISPDTINDNITIAKLTDSPDETSGTIDGNSNKIVYIYIGNNSSSTITLYVGIKYSETSSLNLPDNRTLITGTRDGKYVVGVTVTNGTVENGVTLTNLITNGSFENGSNGWSTSRLTTPNNNVAGTITSSKYATGNNSLYINDTSDTTGYWNYQYFTSTVGDQVYVYAKTNIISPAFSIAINRDNTGSSNETLNSYPTTSNDFILYSSEYTASSTTQYLQLGSSISYSTSEGYFDDVMVINLTDSYGNNTPSQEVLDRSIGYFDGTVSYNYQKINKGNSVTFKVTPNSDYIYDSASCTNSSFSYNESTNILTISNIIGDVSCDVKYRKLTVIEKIKLTSNGKKDIVNIGSTTDEGVWETQDDYGTSYYYRGAVTNNYVKFAGYYWRIIRINGNGSIRLIYDGTSIHANGESSSDRQIGTSVYNSSYNDNAYVGYLYGQARADNYNLTHANTNSSIIKTTIDNWYKTNILDKGYSEKVEEDAIYCNDRSISANKPSSSHNNLGYGANITAYRWYYGPWSGATNNATLKCPQLSQDGMSTSSATKGNKSLTYPVGLITTDESIYAGGYNMNNNKYYLYTGQTYWTMSANAFDGIYAGVWSVNSNGNFNYFSNVNTNYGIRPVLSIKSDVAITGSGTMSDPYVIQ